MSIIWTRYLWWLLWAIVPLTLLNFYNITSYLYQMLHLYSQVKQLSDKNQVKVCIKLIRSIYFLAAHILSIIAFTMFFARNDSVDLMRQDHIPYFADKIVKLCLVLVVSMYFVDITYYQKHMKWYNWSHHGISLVIFVAVYDYSIPFIIRRVYCGIFGVLLTSRWILHVASVYYYLGDKNKINLRVSLYLIGLCFHSIFTFGQLSIGIIFRII
eukprot:58441_1